MTGGLWAVFAPHWKDESMSERASQTAQRYVDAMNIASAKIEQLQAEVEALRAQVQRVRELRDRFRDHEKWASYRRVETLLTRALDGDA